jgi:hypothetical protein
MFKLTTISGIAVSAAVLGIALAAFFASAAPQAKAADRLLVRASGAACSSHSWPYYDQACRFDLRSPSKDARTVRVVALR